MAEQIEQSLAQAPSPAPGLVTPETIDPLFIQSREQQSLDDAAADFERFAPSPSEQGGAERAPGAPGSADDIQVRPLSTGGFGAFSGGKLIAGGETEEDARQAALPAEDRPTILRPGEDVPETAVDFFSDITVQAAGGIRDALQGILELSEPAAEFLQSVVALPGLRFNEDGTIEFLSSEELTEAMTDDPEQALRLPDVPAGRSAFAGLIRKVAQIAFGFKGIGGLLKTAGVKKAVTKTGKIAEATGKGAAADVLVTEKREENLSRLIEDLGEEHAFLKSPLTEALATDIDDTALEAKFKTALEGGILGLGVTGAIEMAKALVALVKLAKAGAKKIGIKGPKTFKERTGFENQAALDAAQEADEAARLAGELDIFTPAQLREQVGDLDRIIAVQRQAIDEETALAMDLEGAVTEGTKAAKAIAGATKKLEAAEAARAKIIGKVSENVTVEVEIANPEMFVKNRQTAAASNDIAAAVDVELAAKRVVPIKRTVPNLAKINTTDDMEAALAKMEADNAPLIAKAKGGVVSQAETHAAGQELGWRELISLDPRKHGITAARLDALKDFYAASAKMVRQTAEVVAEGPTEGNRFAFRKALMIHEALLERFAAARSEAGRALNILKRVSDLDDLEAIRGIKEINQELGGPEATDVLANLIATAKGLSNEALNEVTKRTVMARVGSAVREAWTLGLVSGLRTQGRNLLSNFAFMLTRLPQRALAARLPGSEIEKGEALAGLAAMMWSSKTAFTNAGKAFWHGTSGFGVGKVDLPRRKAIGGELFGLEDGNIKRGLDMLGEFYRVWGRLLVAGDELFKTWNYNAEISMQAWRQTSKAGLTGKAARDNMAKLMTDPTEEMRMTARLEAQRATFTQEPGVIAKMVFGLKSDPNPAIAIPANLMAPFVTTIANITKEGISWTPGAVLMKSTFWKEIQKGGAAKDLALAKLAMGSMAMSTWSDFVMRGYVTGNGPSDPKQRRRWIAAGHRPYSALIGDEWVNYRTIEPLGTMLGIMSDVTEKMVEMYRLRGGDDPEFDRKIGQLAIASLAAVGNTINSQSFSRGMTEIINVMSQPDMYAENYLERLSTTIVPKIVRTGFELFDVPTSQEWKDVRGIAEAIEVELRPWRGIPTRDSLGYPIERAKTLPRRSTLEDDDGPVMRGLQNLASAISPVYVGDPDGGVFNRHIWEQSIRFNKPAKRQTFQQKDFPIDLQVTIDVDTREFPEVWDRFQELAGHVLVHPIHEMTFENMMIAVIEGRHDDSDYYASLPDGDTDGVDDKGKYVKALAEDFRSAAKAIIWEDPAFDEFKEEVIRRSKARQEKIEGLTQ